MTVAVLDEPRLKGRLPSDPLYNVHKLIENDKRGAVSQICFPHTILTVRLTLKTCRKFTGDVAK